NKGEKLITTREDTEKPYDTIVHCTNELQTFIRSLKPKFEHSEKHNRLISRIDIARGYRLRDNKKIYPFSANYSQITNYAQNLLDLAIRHLSEPNKLYYFDDETPTYVCFMHSAGRVYHGFDVPEDDMKEPIRVEVMQKYDAQRNG